jgi:hypothetical protein
MQCRVQILLRAGAKMHREIYNGADSLAYVISLNFKRRHLDESQRAMVAARIANLEEGRPSNTAQICAVSKKPLAKCWRDAGAAEFTISFVFSATIS